MDLEDDDDRFTGRDMSGVGKGGLGLGLSQGRQGGMFAREDDEDDENEGDEDDSSSFEGDEELCEISFQCLAEAKLMPRIFSHLTIIELLQLKQVSKEWAFEINRTQTNYITRLTLNHFWALPPSTWKTSVLDMCESFRNVRYVCLSFCSLVISDDFLFELLGKITREPSQLRGLDLFYCHQLTDRAIIKLVSRYTHLRHLNIGRCPLLTDQGIVAITRRMSRLTVLKLAHNKQLTEASLHTIADTLQNLKYLDISETSFNKELADETKHKHPNLTIIGPSLNLRKKKPSLKKARKRSSGRVKKRDKNKTRTRSVS